MSDTTVIIGPCVLSFASVWKPKRFGDDANSKEKYQGSFIFPKSNKGDVKKVKAAIAAATKLGIEKFGADFPKARKFMNPLRDGDEDRPDDPAYNDSWFVNASSDTQPGIVNKLRKPIIDEDEVYSGCEVYVQLNFYPFKKKGVGIGAGLNHIMKWKDGEQLGGGRGSAESAFADLDIEVDDDEEFDEDELDDFLK